MRKLIKWIKQLMRSKNEIHYTDLKEPDVAHMLDEVHLE